MGQRVGILAAAALRARRWLPAVLAGLVVTACGAAAPSHVSQRLALDDLGPLTGCTGYGHSGIEGYGVPPSQAFLTLVCQRSVGSVLNLGIGGSTLQGQLSEVLGRLPRSHATQLSIVMWGANDLALFGPDLAGYRAGLRMLVSRLRAPAQNVHGAMDPALRYFGNWTSADGERVTTAAASFTWTSPRGFPGGVVAFTATFRRGLGARYAFTLDRRRVGVWDTRALGPPAPAPVANTPGAYRIRVPAGAGHVVRCRLNAVRGGADLLGWQLESARPPLIVLVEHPRPPSFAIYRQKGWVFRPTDAQILALDRAMSEVAAEFDGYVITVDPDAAIDRRPADFLADGFHLSEAGNRVVAKLITRAIAQSPHVRRR
jgi:lysophospholipase L1-like esterase